jgi:Cof subfamily protein (haloacid dehalogenase superfamily)
MSFKLALFDLDGTLLNSNKQILPENLAAIERVKKKALVGFATGRSFLSVVPYVKIVQPNGPSILFNGACVWHAGDDKVIYENKLNLTDALSALNLSKNYDVHVNVYYKDRVFIKERTPLAKEYEIKDDLRANVVGDLEAYVKSENQEPIKIMLIGDPKILADFETRYDPPSNSKPSMIHSEWNYLEIIPSGMNKGKTLSIIEQEYGIKSSEIVSFGDNLNDLDLLINSGLGIAMGNAHADLKRLGDKITTHHDEPGISTVLDDCF